MKEIEFGETFTETTIFIHEHKYWDKSVSENPESRRVQHINNLADLCYKPAFPVFAIFQDELEARKSLKAFFFTAKLITRYSSERFLSIWGQKMSEVL